MEREELMLAQTNPQTAYRRVDFDARVAGANPAQLVALCYERFASSLGSALHAAGRDDNHAKSQALTRALAALTALELGLVRGAPLSGTLAQIYAAARRSVLDSVLAFDALSLDQLRQDFAVIAAATASSPH